MPLVLHTGVTSELFPGGATYQTLVGDERGSTPLRLGLQTAPPGYRTRLHSHPYLEVLTVVSGEAEAWSEEYDAPVRLAAGVTLILPANIKHRFRVVGDEPLKIYGIHASPHRIVEVHHEGAAE
jgi:quercetin dioxygenase-like cupin family protein